MKILTFHQDYKQKYLTAALPAASAVRPQVRAVAIFN